MKYSKKYWKVINNFKNVKNGIYAINCYGDVINVWTGELIDKKIVNKKHHPYNAVRLVHNDGKKDKVLLHQLVATYFVKIPKRLLYHPDIVPDHLDNDGLNNYYKNLEWKTRGENVSDAFKNKYINNSGENHKDVFISEAEAHKICKCLECDLGYDKILKKLKFPNSKKYKTLLVRIKNGYAWKDVASNYNIQSNVYKYSSDQLETISKIPKILELHALGYSASEIFDVIYTNDVCNKKTKINIIRNVYNHKIYKNEISFIIKDTHSTTRES